MGQRVGAETRFDQAKQIADDVLDSLPGGVAVSHPDGITNEALPAGSPYKETGAIAAGGTVTFTLQFTRTGTYTVPTPRLTNIVVLPRRPRPATIGNFDAATAPSSGNTT